MPGSTFRGSSSSWGSLKTDLPGAWLRLRTDFYEVGHGI
jgi:hypothetical protein